MTYLQFLLIFIIPLVIAGIIYYQKSRYAEKTNLKQGMFFLMFLAMTYTTPWDNYLVKSGVWSYEDHNILFKIGYVPFEEYMFFILQTMMTSFWCLFIFSKNKITTSSEVTVLKPVVTTLLSLFFVLSIYFLFNTSTRYLGLILVWALPVALLQWVVGGQHLIRNIKVYMLCLLPPTMYLWIVDAYAIYDGVWSISTAQTTGFKLGNLPIEESIFFLATNVMLCQGLILFMLLKNDFLKLIKRKT